MHFLIFRYIEISTEYRVLFLRLPQNSRIINSDRNWVTTRNHLVRNFRRRRRHRSSPFNLAELTQRRKTKLSHRVRRYPPASQASRGTHWCLFVLSGGELHAIGFRPRDSRRTECAPHKGSRSLPKWSDRRRPCLSAATTIPGKLFRPLANKLARTDADRDHYRMCSRLRY